MRALDTRSEKSVRLVWDVSCGPHLTESALIEVQYDMDQERIEREKNAGPEVRAGTHISHLEIKVV